MRGLPRRLVDLGRWRPRKLHVVAALIVGVFVARAVTQPEPELIPPEPLVAVADGLTLETTARVAAGTPLNFTVGGLTEGEPVELILESSYGTSRYELSVPDAGPDPVEVTVAGWDGPASGLMTAHLIQGSRIASTGFTLSPGRPVDPISVYTGPRTVVANGQDRTMQVAIPLDEFGNPVAGGTTVTYLVEQVATSDGEIAENSFTHNTEFLLSWVEIRSTTAAGRSRISTVTDGADGTVSSGEATFQEVAGVPDGFELGVVGPLPVADGQSLTVLRTGLVLDRFGNILPDGTTAFVDVDGTGGLRRINSQVIDGAIDFTLEVPDEPGRLTAIAHVSGSWSEPLTIEFDQAVDSLVAELDTIEDYHRVTVGPVTSVRGSYVPDGTMARVRSADGQVIDAELMLGVGHAYFGLGTDVSEVTVEVLGRTIRVTP